MIDGRFDQHFLELFARETPDREDRPRPLRHTAVKSPLFGLARRLIIAIAAAFPAVRRN